MGYDDATLCVPRKDYTDKEADKRTLEGERGRRKREKEGNKKEEEELLNKT